VLICAVGSEPVRLPVPGAENDNVHYVTEKVLPQLGHRVVVIGGGLVGCEYALHLALSGHETVIIEMQETLAPDAGFMHRINLMHQIEINENITTATGLRVSQITDTGVVARDENDTARTFEADDVVIAVGLKPLAAEAGELTALVPASYIVGDAGRAANVMRAVRAGYDAAVDIGL
jgi:pyruvate/2-oxoglutarate dehydrogenase complex dihydrolipoamide dehydrogenase (E3) component